jgi:hypothetical protein
LSALPVADIGMCSGSETTSHSVGTLNELSRARAASASVRRSKLVTTSARAAGGRDSAPLRVLAGCRLTDDRAARARCLSGSPSRGGRAPFLDNPMQRYFRDVHAMRAHALNNPDKASQVFGYAELHPAGTPPEFFL